MKKNTISAGEVTIMTVDISIPLDDPAARVLQNDPIKRQALGRLISQKIL